MSSSQSVTVDDVQSPINEVPVRAGQLWAAYTTGQSVNHLRWLSEVAVLDGRPIATVKTVESVIVDLAPVLIRVVPATAIDQINIVLESCRVEWADLLNSQWFSEVACDAHIDFSAQGGSSNSFHIPLLSARSPWMRLRASILAAITASPSVLTALQIGEKTDQMVHTSDVVDALQGRLIDEFPANSNGNPECPVSLGGKRQFRAAEGILRRPSSTVDLPVIRNWHCSLLALCRKIGIENLGLAYDEFSDGEAVDESVLIAFENLEHLGSGGAVPQKKTKRKRGARKDPDKPGRDRKIRKCARDNPGMSHKTIAERMKFPCSRSTVTKTLNSTKLKSTKK